MSSARHRVSRASCIPARSPTSGAEAMARRDTSSAKRAKRSRIGITPSSRTRLAFAIARTSSLPKGGWKEAFSSPCFVDAAAATSLNAFCS